MTTRKKKALGRGMADLVDGTFSAIVEPTPAGEPRSAPAEAPEPTRPAPARPPEEARRPPSRTAPQPLHARPSAPSPLSVPRSSRGPEPAPHPGTAAPVSMDVITVSSGKGGTGKSVLTSNVAVLLAGTTRVTVMDADLGLANVHILYNLMPRYNVSDVIAGRKSLHEIALPAPGGVTLIPGGSGIPELASMSDPMFGALAREIAELDRSCDLLLVDTPSGIDRQSLLFLMASDHVLVVTTEDITALTDAYAVIKTVLARRPSASVALIVNQARSQAHGLEAFHKVAHVARKFLGRELALGGIVPFDETVERSVAAKVPVVLSDPGCPAARAIAALAERLDLFHRRAARTGAPFSVRLRGALAGSALGPAG